MSENTNEIGTLAQGAMAQGTFDVLAAAKDRGYPSEVVEVFLDQEAAHTVTSIDRKLANVTDLEDVQIEVSESLRAEAVKRYNESVLRFRMRGFNQGTIEALQAQSRAKFPAPHERDNPTDEDIEAVNNDRMNWFMDAVIAEHIVDVTNHAGAVDTHHWSPDEVTEVRALIPEKAWQTLAESANRLTFEAAYFDMAVSADFS